MGHGFAYILSGARSICQKFLSPERETAAAERWGWPLPPVTNRARPRLIYRGGRSLYLKPVGGRAGTRCPIEAYCTNKCGGCYYKDCFTDGEQGALLQLVTRRLLCVDSFLLLPYSGWRSSWAVRM